MVLFLILLGCDDDAGVHGARARARSFLDEHGEGTALVRVGIGAPTLDAVVGDRWESTDLSEFLRICGAPPADFDAELTVGPDAFPHPYLTQSAEEPVSACVWDRLATFPVDGPSRRNEKVLFVVRWRPDESADGIVLHEQADEGLPRGALTQAPPYFRHGSGIVWQNLKIDANGPRFRYETGPVVAGALPEAGEWARQLTCNAAERDLVRATLIFDGGELDEVHTMPSTPCIEERARAEADWFGQQQVGGELVADLTHLAVVLDVPVRAW